MSIKEYGKVRGISVRVYKNGLGYRQYKYLMVGEHCKMHAHTAKEAKFCIDHHYAWVQGNISKFYATI